MNYADLFCGIGGFRLGIEKASKGKSKCVYSNDFNKYARQVYKKNFGEEPDGRDIKTINAEELPDFDLLCAGFPCQSFSIAGKRKGFEDTRGTLFYDLARIIKAKRPQIILLENVKGLLSAQKGYYFARILEALDELGYVLQWQVLNSKDFGVPQNRERVFIVGYPGKKGFKKIFPIRESSQESNVVANPETAYSITSTYGKGGKGSMIELTENQSKGNRVYSSEGIASSICGNAGGQGAKTGLYMIGNIQQKVIKRKFETPVEINVFLRYHKRRFTNRQISKFTKLPLTTIEHYFRVDKSRAIPSKKDWVKLKELLRFPNTYDSLVTETIEKFNEFEMNQWVYSSKGLAKTISSGRETGLYAVGCAYRTRTYAGLEGRIETRKDALANQLTTVQKDSMVYSNRIRRLTPIECERLQGFPDNWTEGLSDTQRYKCLGNAVTVNVVQAIMEKVLEVKS